MEAKKLLYKLGFYALFAKLLPREKQLQLQGQVYKIIFDSLPDDQLVFAGI